LEFDLEILEALNNQNNKDYEIKDEQIKLLIQDRKDHLWRLKLAVIHRVN
jgi:hypothetical protein